MSDALDECNQGLDEDPANLQLLQQLVDLCREDGHPEDACQRLWAASRQCELSGNGASAVWIFRRLAELDPESTRNLAWLAQLSCRLVFHSRFAEVPEHSARAFRKKGDLAGLVAWAQRLLALDRADPSLADVIAEPWLRDHSEPDALLKLGEIYQRAGHDAAAVRCFVRVADQHARDGFFMKAVAILKQALKLDPSQAELHLRLADLHEQLQLISGARTYLLQAESAFEQSGDAARRLEVLERLKAFDARN